MSRSTHLPRVLGSSPTPKSRLPSSSATSVHCRNLTRSPAVLLSLFSACPLTGQRDSITMSNWKFLPNFHPFVATKMSSRQTSSKHVWPGSSECSGSEDTKDDFQSFHNADWCLATRKMSETVLSAVSCLKDLQILNTAAMRLDLDICYIKHSLAESSSDFRSHPILTNDKWYL